MKKIVIGLGFVALVLGLAFIKREALMLSFLASQTEKTSLDQRVALLEDAIVYSFPENAAPPYPVVIQFHGCAGMRIPFHSQWAKVANDAGYAAMLVDSHRPRGIKYETALQTVCAGKKLVGQERAGDILAALEIAAARDDFDADQIVVAGWSHGAWSVMDYLTMDLSKEAPAGLARQATAPPEIKGAILFYPYCGPGARSRIRPWVQIQPTLALLGDNDSMVDAEQCIQLFNQKNEKGADVDLHVYEGAEHVFDDPNMTGEYANWYNENYHDDAIAQYKEFLTSIRLNTAQ